MRTRSMLAAAVAAASLLVACGSDSGSSGALDTDTYCAKIKEYKAKASGFDSIFSSDTPDAKATETAFTTMQEMLQTLTDTAPAEIKTDVSTVNDATKELIAIFAKYEWDVAKLATATDDATKLQAIMSDTKVSEASDRLDTFSQDTCGIAQDS